MTGKTETWYGDSPLWIGPALAILIVLLRSAFGYAQDFWQGAGKADVEAKPSEASVGERSFPQPVSVRICFWTSC